MKSKPAAIALFVLFVSTSWTLVHAEPKSRNGLPNTRLDSYVQLAPNGFFEPAPYYHNEFSQPLNAPPYFGLGHHQKGTGINPRGLAYPLGYPEDNKLGSAVEWVPNVENFSMSSPRSTVRARSTRSNSHSRKHKSEPRIVPYEMLPKNVI